MEKLVLSENIILLFSPVKIRGLEVNSAALASMINVRYVEGNACPAWYILVLSIHLQLTT